MRIDLFDLEVQYSSSALQFGWKEPSRAKPEIPSFITKQQDLIKGWDEKTRRNVPVEDNETTASLAANIFYST